MAAPSVSGIGIPLSTDPLFSTRFAIAGTNFTAGDPVRVFAPNHPEGEWKGRIVGPFGTSRTEWLAEVNFAPRVPASPGPIVRALGVEALNLTVESGGVTSTPVVFLAVYHTEAFARAAPAVGYA